MSDVTRILSEIEQGDGKAAERLLPLVYDELRKLATQRMTHERPGQTLQATALVHEAYLRLVDVEQVQHWNSRGHFFAAAAEAMRRILVESARRKKGPRHGGESCRVGLNSRIPAAELPIDHDRLLALNAALDRLQEQDACAASLVKLKFFAGLTMSQVAETLGISLRTAERNWTYARTWLHRALSDSEEGNVG